MNSVSLFFRIKTRCSGKGKRGLCGKETLETALLHWQEEQDHHEREKKSEMIEHMFKEHKSERGKEVRKVDDRELLNVVMGIVGKEKCRDDCAEVPLW